MASSGLLLLTALGVMVVSLIVQWRRVRRLPAPSEHAPAAGRAGAGIRYAFTTAFLPWSKESGRRHPMGYGAGVVLHGAVMVAGTLAVVGVWRPLPSPGWGGGVLVVALAAGLVAGLGLLIRRLATPRVRSLSIPDDFVAVGLVTASVVAGLGAVTGLLPLSALHGAVALLALYLPLGKLRHMVFLVASRVYWGRTLGRRGVLPPTTPTPMERP